MINSKNVKAILEQTLRPIKLDNDFETPGLESSTLISSLNGSMLSYATATKTENNGSLELNSLNNLKMLSLLSKDKWSEDEQTMATATAAATAPDLSLSSTSFSHADNNNNNNNNTTNSLHHQQQQKQLRFCYHYNVNDDPSHPTRIYTYEIEDLHTCIAQIPQSDLLLLLIADSKFPYGLLVMKMRATLRAFKDMFNYKLG